MPSGGSVEDVQTHAALKLAIILIVSVMPLRITGCSAVDRFDCYTSVSLTVAMPEASFKIQR